jgi:hypothetical protein
MRSLQKRHRRVATIALVVLAFAAPTAAVGGVFSFGDNHVAAWNR